MNVCSNDKFIWYLPYRHGIVGILAVEYLHSIPPLHSNTLLGIIPYSSNLIFYMLVLLVRGTTHGDIQYVMLVNVSSPV